MKLNSPQEEYKGFNPLFIESNRIHLSLSLSLSLFSTSFSICMRIFKPRREKRQRRALRAKVFESSDDIFYSSFTSFTPRLHILENFNTERGLVPRKGETRVRRLDLGNNSSFRSVARSEVTLEFISTKRI